MEDKVTSSVAAENPSDQDGNLQGRQMESVQLQEVPSEDQEKPNQIQMMPVQDQTFETKERSYQNSTPEISSTPTDLEEQLAQLSLKEKGMMNFTLRKFPEVCIVFTFI